jgi:hypothetical protein
MRPLRAEGSTSGEIAASIAPATDHMRQTHGQVLDCEVFQYELRPGDAFTLLAPAKINLTLEVVRRRADGYHDIARCFTLSR